MLLAIDTSTAQIGLALYDGTSVPASLSGTAVCTIPKNWHRLWPNF